MALKRSRATYEADLQRLQSPYVLFGTPLPPLDPNVRDDGSFVPVWKQEVTDERGRKRLHGAFTGGFSAGYFNTVGSKEGWTPSTFVSSRSNRHDKSKAAQQRAEDFMDEEDLAEHAESQKLQTAQSFAGLGGSEDDPARRGLMMDLWKSQGETMGVKLLQKMGWRQGQGVGPKIRRQARLDADEGPGGEEQKTHLFAPENSRMITFTKKSDHKGLGYAGEARLSSDAGGPKAITGPDEDDGDPSGIISLAPSKKKTAKPAKKSSFGVGVLNDTGSDDEDPYEMGPKLSYNRTIESTKKKAKKQANSAANPLLGNRPVFVSKKHSSRTAHRKCHDGRPPLSGFVLSVAPHPHTLEVKYVPPKVPDGWQPAQRRSNQTNPAASYTSTADAAKSSTHDPATRGALLGESALPTKSIFSYLTPAARERLASASGRVDLPAAGSEAPPPEYAKSAEAKRRDLWSLVPELPAATAAAALSRGWMPYGDDPSKRARYRAFLELRAGTGAASSLPERVPDSSIDEWATELREFARAAQVFRPVSGMMASRFTSAKDASAPPPPRPVEGGPDDGEAPLVRDPRAEAAAREPEDPALQAARMGMFGPLTRSETRFYPTRLTCKRFGVPPPDHGAMDPGTEFGGADAGPAETKEKVREAVGKETLEEMMREVAMRPDFVERGAIGARGGESASASGTAEQPSVLRQPAVVDTERNEALEQERPGDAVFRAIFGSDDEDDEDDDD